MESQDNSANGNKLHMDPNVFLSSDSPVLPYLFMSRAIPKLPFVSKLIKEQQHLLPRGYANVLFHDDLEFGKLGRKPSCYVLFQEWDLLSWRRNLGGYPIAQLLKPTGEVLAVAQQEEPTQPTKAFSDAFGTAVSINVNIPFLDLSPKAQSYAIVSQLAGASHLRKTGGLVGEYMAYGSWFGVIPASLGAFAWMGKSIWNKKPLPLGSIFKGYLKGWGGLIAATAMLWHNADRKGHQYAIEQGHSQGGIEYFKSKMWRIDTLAYNHPNTWGCVTRAMYGIMGQIDQPSTIRKLEKQQLNQ